MQVLTCPPYGFLEVYTDLPGDLSNMSAADFEGAYGQIITLAAQKLAASRFAVYVLGNFRDTQGYLKDLCGLTVRSHHSLGCGSGVPGVPRLRG